MTQVGRYRAVVTCGKCGVSHEVPWLRSYMPIDAYSTWYDIVTGRVSPEAVRERIEKLEAAIAESPQIGAGEEELTGSESSEQGEEG